MSGSSKPRMATLLAIPELRKFETPVKNALAAGTLDRPAVMTFLRWRSWRKSHGFSGPANHTEFEDFIGPRPFLTVYFELGRAIHVLMPGAPDGQSLCVAREGHSKRLNKTQKAGPRARMGPAPKYSIPEAELPREWLVALEDMEARKLGVNGMCPPGKSKITQIRYTLRQVGCAARRADHEIALVPETLSVFIRDLVSRPVRATTIATRAGELSTFARYIGAGAEIIGILAQEARYYEKQAKLVEKTKETFIRESGMSLETIAEAACARLEDVRGFRGSPSLEKSLFAACRDTALLAICVSCAPRKADITKLTVGRSMKRHERQWEIDYCTLKNGENVNFFIDERLTKFLDQAILFGADSIHIRRMYDDRIGTPFFVRDMSMVGLHIDWPYRRVRTLLNSGPHIARTLWFEAGEQMGADGIEAAMALCGHRSLKSSQHYRTARARQNSATVATGLLADIFMQDFDKDS